MDIKKLYKRYEEIIVYGIFGVLTTIINYAVYKVFTDIFPLPLLVANTIAFIIAVLFAFVTNKRYVFKSSGKWEQEIVKFYSYRLFSLFIESAIMYIFVTMLSYNDDFIKISANIIVIILNFVFSKLFVYKK